MFKKKLCKNCKEKVSSKHNFCPECGINLKEPNNDYGMLGKNDQVNEENLSNMFNGFGGGIMNKMLTNAMKMLEKEMNKEMQKDMKKANQSYPRTNFELFINGKRIDPEKIKVSKGPAQMQASKRQKINFPFSEENRKKFLKLEKQEPKTNLKRIEGKVIYEIELPKVKSIQDVSIVQLENSIEIKAIAKNEAYSKIIGVNLPVSNYRFKEGKLFLELKAIQ